MTESLSLETIETPLLSSSYEPNLTIDVLDEPKMALDLQNKVLTLSKPAKIDVEDVKVISRTTPFETKSFSATEEKIESRSWRDKMMDELKSRHEIKVPHWLDICNHRVIKGYKVTDADGYSFGRKIKAKVGREIFYDGDISLRESGIHFYTSPLGVFGGDALSHFENIEYKKPLRYFEVSSSIDSVPDLIEPITVLEPYFPVQGKLSSLPDKSFVLIGNNLGIKLKDKLLHLKRSENGGKIAVDLIKYEREISVEEMNDLATGYVFCKTREGVEYVEIYNKGLLDRDENEGPAVIYQELCSTASRGSNGIQKYYKNGKLHRIRGPASMYPKLRSTVTLSPRGTYLYDTGEIMEWYTNGLLHRDDGPAYIDDIFEKYYKNGKLHRIDGPAVINKKTGECEWHYEGRLHRNEDHGPAVDHKDRKEYRNNGELHRLKGPAVIADGFEEWHIRGRLHRDMKDGGARVHFNVIENGCMGTLHTYFINGDYRGKIFLPNEVQKVKKSKRSCCF